MNFSNISNLNQSLELEETNSALSSYFSEAEAAALVVVVAFLASVGFLLNLLLILSIIQTYGFADAPANLFVLSLACADLLLCCLLGPIFIYNCYCPMIYTFLSVGRFVSLATTGNIFLLSLNRLISIVTDLKYPSIMTFKRTVTLVGIVWFVAILVTTLAVVGLIYDIQPIIPLTRYFMGFYVISSVVMHVYMYKLGRKHRRQLAQQAFAVTGQIQARSDEFKALRSLFMITGSFAACWLPLTIEAFFEHEMGGRIHYHRTLLFTSTLCFVNSIADPIIYYYRSKGFRASLNILVGRLKNVACCECN